ncbi:MAG TPA: hypothetical protein VI653_08470 [Steroidobacteraceae bacterium]
MVLGVLPPAGAPMQAGVEAAVQALRPVLPVLVLALLLAVAMQGPRLLKALPLPLPPVGAPLEVLAQQALGSSHRAPSAQPSCNSSSGRRGASESGV